jgi:hypothetical protein
MKRFTILLAAFVLMASMFMVSSGAAAESNVCMAAVGDTVYFGCYEQGLSCAGEQSPIEWNVLDERDGKLLLISKTGLETGPFNSKKQRAAWAESSVRAWLNCDFLAQAFSEEEQNAIMETTVSTPAGCFISPATGEEIQIAECPDTGDLVFLLNVAEVEQYFPEESQRMIENNSYLLDKPESTMPYPAEGDACDFTYGNWWLRDVRVDKGINCAFHVMSYGKIASAGQINLKRYVIRPAMWVDANYPFEFGE